MKRRPVVCLCIAAAALFALGAGTPARAQTVELAAVPDDSIALRYYRADGKYKSWGVHFWQSFEKMQDGKVAGPKDKSDKPLAGITWGSPMEPTGTDGFGAYWIVKASEFGNTKVNYIIHNGDTKECEKDSTWIVPQGKQAFINARDCTAYFSLEEAMKNRK